LSVKIHKKILCRPPKQFSESEIDKFREIFSLSHPIVQILFNRRLDTKEKIESFLYPSLENLLDPFIFNDMDKATNRIMRAIKEKEPILVYGDYDADGISSIALVLRNLRALSAEAYYYVPNRLTEGYGINKKAVKIISEKGFKLIITVDCGINAESEVELAKNLGMDVIVTDHHVPKEELRSAYAVINPKTKGEKYPFKELAGVGVSFKLLSGVFSKAKRDGEMLQSLDLVAIGTIADVVSMTGENRILVKSGIDVLNNTDKIGISALIEKSGLKKGKIGAYEVGYVLAPRINASGRLDTAYDSVELLLTDDRGKAWEYANALNTKNRIRQELHRKVATDSIRIIEKEGYDKMQGGIVLAKEDWHEGVVGIAASKIAEDYSRPTILISTAGEFGKGSGRSVKSFSLLDALDSCRDYLLKYGGHRHAVGLTIRKEKISEFRQAFNKVVRERLIAEDLVNEMNSEAALFFSEIDGKLILELKQLEPFGIDNPEPIFLTENVDFVGYPKIVGKNHIKIKVRENNIVLDSIGFGKAEIAKDLEIGMKIYSIYYFLRENTYMNKRKIQLNLLHLERPEGESKG